jgi:Uma2 family endonuclease
MTSMPVMPREARDWTVDDLERLPDDGLRYELVDGMLLVSPAPVVVHQFAAVEIAVLLRAACPPHLMALVAPVDWRPDRRTSLQPDVLVVDRSNLDAKNITGPLPLAVEILSPSGRRVDRLLKRSTYEDAGVLSYWLVDPEEPSVVALDRVDGRFQVVGEAKGDERLDLRRPFPVGLVPSALVTP